MCVVLWAGDVSVLKQTVQMLPISTHVQVLDEISSSDSGCSSQDMSPRSVGHGCVAPRFIVQPHHLHHAGPVMHDQERCLKDRQVVGARCLLRADPT